MMRVTKLAIVFLALRMAACAPANSAPLVERLSLPMDGTANDARGRTPERAEGVSFSAGHQGQALLVSIEKKTILRWPLADSFDPNRGAVDFWFCPKWPGNDGKPHCLLSDDSAYFRLMKDDGGNLVFVFYRSDWKPSVVLATPVRDWKAEEWRHLRAEWDVEGKAQLVIDDKVVAEKTMDMKGGNAQVGRNLCIGSSHAGEVFADGLIDELRVFGSPISSAQQAVLEGKPTLSFPLDGASQSAEGLKPDKAEGLQWVDGRSEQAARLSEASNSLFTISRTERINPRAGVIELWLRPTWDGDEKKSRVIVADSSSYFQLVKTDWRAIAFVYYNPKWESAVSVWAPIDKWKAGEWHFVRLVWDVEDEAVLYVDNTVGEPKPFTKKDVTMWNTLCIGSRLDGGGCIEADLDDLRIFDHATYPKSPRRPGPLPLELKGVRAFDFGPEHVLAEPGFERVSQRDLFTEGKEFGWSVRLDRATGTADAKGEAFLERTFVESQGEATFRMRVADGDYRLCLVLGDLGGTPPAFDVLVGDRVLIPRLDLEFMTPRIVLRQFDVTVQGGQLDLTFRGQPAFLVNGLVLYPKSAAPQVEPVVGALEKDIFWARPEELKKWVFADKPDTTPPPTLTAEETKRGYVLFARDYCSFVYPDTKPLRDEIDRELSAFGTPGEYEPVAFGLYPKKKLERVNVTVTDLKSPEGRRIGADNIVLRRARYWPQRTAWSGKLEARTVPELLPKATTIDVNETTLYWLTVHVPGDVKPGVYKGEVRVTAANGGELRKPIVFRVLPFTLKSPPQLTFGVYDSDAMAHAWRWPTAKAEWERRGTYQRMLEKRRRDYEDMAAHGIQTFTIGTPRVFEKDGQVTYDATAIIDTVEVARKAGLMTRPMPGGCPALDDIGRLTKDQDYPSSGLEPTTLPPKFSEKFEEIYVGGIRYMQNLAKERGWPEILFYTVDEPGSELRHELCSRLLKLVKRVPGARNYVTGIPHERYLDGGILPWCEVPCYTDGEWTPDDPAKCKGHWFYPNSAVSNSGDAANARFKSGFGFYASGLEGVIPWTYRSTQGNPESDFDSRMCDFYFSLPEPDEHVPTIQWEAFREGIDDCRYFHTLEYLIQQAKESKSPAVRSAVAEAERTVNEIRQSTPKLSQFDKGLVAAALFTPDKGSAKEVPFDREQWVSSNLQRFRQATASQIVHLQNALAGRVSETAKESPRNVRLTVAPRKDESRTEPPLLRTACATATDLTVDGRLTEPCWQRVLPLSLVISEDGRPPREATEAMTLHDEKFLYVGFRCFDRDMNNLSAKLTARDSDVWHDDCVEVYLQPSGKPDTMYQMLVGAGGGLEDLKHVGGDYDVKWNCSFDAAVTKHADRWEVEMRIPLAEVELDGRMPCAINLCREEKTYLENTCWSPTGSGFAVPERFGQLLFSEATIHFAAVPSLKLGVGESIAHLVVENSSATALKGIVRATVDDGKAMESPVDIPARKRVSVPVRLEMPGTGEHSVKCELLDATGQVADRYSQTVATPPLLEFNLRSPYYFVGAEAAQATGRINASAALREKCSLTVQLQDASGNVISKQSISKLTESVFVANLTAERLVPSNYGLRVDLLQGDKSLATAEATLRVQRGF